ncbi:MAG: type I glyceraldehyde-3-phosphate dehydrogenase [Bradymonadales bacterium]|nr:type I glyceraldehyde-3-phosphate dehydrogenase [Bradymonadales bacterium]
MGIRIGINGFGRIGRCVIRGGIANPNFEFVAVNDLSDVEALAHLLRYDSIHKKFGGTVETDGSNLVVNGHRIQVLAERDPARLPWSDLKVDVVLECTGRFLSQDKAIAHIQGGAKKVILSAPAKGAVDGTFVMGVNQHAYDPARHHIVSNASCTTNCVAPMTKVLHEAFGIASGFMTTIHSYTNDQVMLDGIHKDYRRARSGAVSQIPTTTGAAKAVGLVLPDLKGKLDGIAIRVPTPNGSLVDLVINTERPVSKEAINAAVKEAAAGPLAGILEFATDPLVSVDIIGNSHSCVFDSLLTMALGDRMAKVFGWYDNEWGYSLRLLDLAQYVGERL